MSSRFARSDQAAAAAAAFFAARGGKEASLEASADAIAMRQESEDDLRYQRREAALAEGDAFRS